MINNDIIRRIRYVFDFSDTAMISLFRHTETQVTRAELTEWLTREDEEGFVACSDRNLALFLNGLIIEKRGKKEGALPIAEDFLTNNMILMKLKIALNIQAEEVLGLLQLSEFRVSKHELSAFFRRPGHKHYRECLDQFLRHFLNGMKLHYRDGIKLPK